MRISQRTWLAYIAKLRAINDKAGSEMLRWIERNGLEDPDAMIDFAYALATKYGAANAELAAEMYDATARLSRRILPAALPAGTATMHEVAKAIVGTAKSGNPQIVSSAVSRLVKQAGVDTTMQNAIRDKAEWAWIPQGDTCAFCMTLASRGWQNASRDAMNGDHAEHIHANCDCTYAVRFDSRSNVSGYDPDKYRKLYDDAPGKNSRAKVNAMRRELYAENREKINEQKRENYSDRQEREE